MKPGKHNGREVILHDDGAIAKAGCVVVNAAGEILLVTNAKRDAWGLPKGHAEHGERLEEVAARETEEETGYKIQLERRLEDLIYNHGKTGRVIRVAFWLARPVGEQSDVHEEGCEWVSADRAKELVWPNVAAYLAAQISQP